MVLPGKYARIAPSMDATTVFGGFLVLLGCASIIFGALLARRSFGLEDQLVRKIQVTTDALRVEAKEVYAQAEEMLDAARAARNRESGRKGGRPPKADTPELDPTTWTREAYMQHLERSGRTIPELEARFFGST